MSSTTRRAPHPKTSRLRRSPVQLLRDDPTERVKPAHTDVASATDSSRRMAEASRARWERWGGVALLAAPALAALATDALRRGSRLWNFEAIYKLTYFAAWVESLVVWSVLLYAASRRSGWGRWVAAVLFVVFSTFAFGGQQYFYEQYHAYLNVDVSLFASNLMD